MWSPIKFKLFLKQFKDRKEFLNQPVNSFTQISQIIAEKLYLSDETVKSWTRNNSNGPGDRDTKEKLAAVADSKPRALCATKRDMVNASTKRQRFKSPLSAICLAGFSFITCACSSGVVCRDLP